MDADVVRGECQDVGVELEDDAPPPGVVVVLGGRELDGAGGAGRVEAQGALVRVQRVRVESEDERPNFEMVILPYKYKYTLFTSSDIRRIFRRE